MDIGEYQKQALVTANFTHDQPVEYCLLGLAGEVGEVCNKYKKVIRGDYANKPAGHIAAMEKDLAKELGDCLWYLAVAAHELGHNLEDIAYDNIIKLRDRAERGVIMGNGDNR